MTFFIPLETHSVAGFSRPAIQAWASPGETARPHFAGNSTTAPAPHFWGTTCQAFNAEDALLLKYRAWTLTATWVMAKTRFKMLIERGRGNCYPLGCERPDVRLWSEHITAKLDQRKQGVFIFQGAVKPFSISWGWEVLQKLNLWCWPEHIEPPPGLRQACSQGPQAEPVMMGWVIAIHGYNVMETIDYHDKRCNKWEPVLKLLS